MWCPGCFQGYVLHITKCSQSSYLVLTKQSQHYVGIVRQANEQRIRRSSQLCYLLGLMRCSLSIQRYLCQYPFRGDLTLSHHFGWPHNEQWHFCGAKNALGDTAQHPALKAAAPMSRHGNEITRRILLDLLHIFTDFCYANERASHIWINGYRRGDREMEPCQVTLAQFPH